jgi:hypothetical protein
MNNEKYIAGYTTVSKEMMKLIQDDILTDVIETIIPIYTLKNLNPKSGKQDCPITKREKERFRTLMKEKLMAAKNDEERQKVIDHYKQLFEQ